MRGPFAVRISAAMDRCAARHFGDFREQDAEIVWTAAPVRCLEGTGVGADPAPDGRAH